MARNSGALLKDLLRRAQSDARTRRLNLYQRAKFANSFKWRLMEQGVAAEIADDVTRRLVVQLSLQQHDLAAEQVAAAEALQSSKAHYLFAEANRCVAQHEPTEAIGLYQAAIRADPRLADAYNNLAAALCEVGRYEEAEANFREAIRVRTQYPEAHANLGALLRWRGRLDDAAATLRHAVKLDPASADARSNLGLALAALGRTREAKVQLRKVLKADPRHGDALLGMAFIARIDGRFDESSALVNRALRAHPGMPAAWAAVVAQRRMTRADGAWLKHALELAGTRLAPLQEADLRFAIGKFCDDTGDFDQAFESYRQANELLKASASTYDRQERALLVDELIRGYTESSVAATAQEASASEQPVFVVGMMRSGTSLVEQIIAAHPDAAGAGELGFWHDRVAALGPAARLVPIDARTRQQLSGDYLRLLAERAPGARRVVDKAPGNSDYLGVIRGVFRNARIIYMRRNPLDTCLSCYFQQLSPALNYTMDLGDLTHYYEQHLRLVAHWRKVLPPGSILEVPYAELVADQVGWTRTILDFIGLEWNSKCLEFHKAQRAVATASAWQVRQRIYRDSLDRWRNYERHLGPLRRLEGAEPLASDGRRASIATA
jgi:tetratricopeptide (TPR) repeat protein